MAKASINTVSVLYYISSRQDLECAGQLHGTEGLGPFHKGATQEYLHMEATVQRKYYLKILLIYF